MEYSNIGLIVLAVVLIIYVIKIYNTLVSYRTQYQNGFSQIDVQLKRRLDLIPNLVDIAKKYMEHENEVLVKVTEARAGMVDAAEKAKANPGDKTAMTNLATQEALLNDAMGGFNLRMEAYPDLKANENMMQLSEEMVSTENRISYARQGYNDLVQKFNEYRNSFPQILFSSLFGFREDATPLEFSESKEELNTAPKVNF